MPSKRDMRDVEKAAGVVADLLVRAIELTVQDHTHEAAREAVAEFRTIDGRAVPESDSGPAELLATLTLVGWLAVVRDRLAGRPDPSAEVLAWVGAHLGPRYQARARFVSGTLRSAEETAAVAESGHALGQDFLPALVWLLAGAVAVHGGSRAEWLRELGAGAPTAASLLA